MGERYTEGVVFCPFHSSASVSILCLPLNMAKSTWSPRVSVTRLDGDLPLAAYVEEDAVGVARVVLSDKGGLAMPFVPVHGCVRARMSFRVRYANETHIQSPIVHSVLHEGRGIRGAIPTSLAHTIPTLLPVLIKLLPLRLACLLRLLSKASRVSISLSRRPIASHATCLPRRWLRMTEWLIAKMPWAARLATFAWYVSHALCLSSIRRHTRVYV